MIFFEEIFLLDTYSHVICGFTYINTAAREQEKSTLLTKSV